MEKSISVIIPSYNSQRTIVHTIESLKKQKGDYIQEIIIVDSSDSEEMKEMVKKYSSEYIIFINAGIRVKPATGRNIGARQAKGRIFVFLDADVILENDYMERIIAAHERGMLVGCGGIDIPGFQRKNKIVLSQYYLQLSEYIPHGISRPKANLAGCNLFCERNIFIKSGGFPDIRAAEDVLFGMNAGKLTTTWFIPQAVVYHIFREERKGYLDNQKMLGTYIGVFRANLSRSLIYRGIIPAVLSPLFFVFKNFLVISRVISAGSPHLRRYIKVLPTVSSGILYWTIGMVDGAMKYHEKTL